MFNKKSAKIILSLFLIVTLTASAVYLNYNISSKSQSIHTLSKLGSRGDEVRRIQKKLKEAGFYNGAIDGIYGTATKQAVIAFQKSCGITAAGVAGANTL